MVKVANLKPYHISILHYWNMGIRSARKIHAAMKIPLSTISYQLKNLRTEGSLQHWKGNDRKQIIYGEYSQGLGQFIRRNKEITLNELVEKLCDQCQLTVSTSTVSRHLKRFKYQNCLPLNTPMLTSEYKQYRIDWTREHLNDDWQSTIFTDESSFQVFRNTIRRWSKTPKEEKKRVPKNRKKVHAWGAISYRRKIGFHLFQNIMDSDYYIEILEKNLISNAKRKFNNRWRLQQDNDPKHRSPKTQGWLTDNIPQVLDWSSNSSDIKTCGTLSNVELNEENHQISTTRKTL